MAPSHDDDHQETPPGHQEETPPGRQETQPPATPPARFRYPPGCRFVPTDCELIRDYLQKKVNNEPIPLSDHIKETNVKLKSPEALAAELPKLGENDWYFFTPRDRKYPNGERPDRAADSGYWKPIGRCTLVFFEERVIGFKQSLVFYEGKPTKGERTEWIMHEFTLNQTRKRRTPDDFMRLDDWVLCRIHKRNNAPAPASASASASAPPNINNNRPNYRGGGGGGKKRKIH